MRDLNDVLVFTAVVDHSGFSAAARALGRPKSSISRQIERLEASLGVRLLERSTRRVRLTEVGNEYYLRCREGIRSLEEAEHGVALHRKEPVGTVRVTCPTAISRYVMADLLPGFMARHPAIRIHLQSTNSPADLLKDRIDVAIRARSRMQDEGITMRRLGLSRLILVAAPGWKSLSDATAPTQLTGLPFLSFQEESERPAWTMRGPEGATHRMDFEPVLWSSEFEVLLEAACAGAGLALLPAGIAMPAIARGRLVRVLPGWSSEDVTIHLVFPTKRGLPPAVRVFIDYVAQWFESNEGKSILLDPRGAPVAVPSSAPGVSS